jgi:DNA-binding NarL/FixJ family response regulator
VCDGGEWWVRGYPDAVDELRSMSEERGAPSGTRVLIVDDHDLFRAGLRSLLEEQGFNVADAASGESALVRMRSFPADVVVMDVNMPGMSGIVATRRLLEQDPATSVLMLTITSADERVLEAVRAGASGYLLKDAELNEIVAGITAAAAGRSAIDPQVAATLVAHARQTATTGPEESPGPLPRLSVRERDVLALLVEGCDNAEIARRLFVSPSTVKNHVSSVLEKLGVENRVQAAVYATRHGLVDWKAPPSG